MANRLELRLVAPGAVHWLNGWFLDLSVEGRPLWCDHRVGSDSRQIPVLDWQPVADD